MRRRTRSLLRSSAKKGLSSLLVEYAPEDKVVIKIDPTQVKGMPHRRFNGLVGTVTEVDRRAVTVDVKVGDKVKKLIARKEHLVKMGGS
ncbi:MAG: 50S ribosomal protein L21 [Nitrososphaerota archaeon]|jgi:large subunit ribosomal protein L21e|nr:50S ribosomal protein L21 [Nitrososphaerota archaeon]MDG6952920.1 50S ribosomal protein L21 [Nitrososphaerota archaeon]MDG6956451.1 50S ribosomal protein L21 [Nitrososphaerota archaeon]MDG6958916.1 50S ribosomal protein L21 [Nitrososphaerota archaeon]MDG6960303.1 50S ribosomal protein L21 [Nitrososphaerota archaeon]